ncbi:PEP-CTERM sorting domain-containing protein [Duganella sp. P38]|uniref:PEP-CTERM sorting domain-containing protein n=1 Tax=Duganella sp. P38 TaxID=3423949 RepID=UPI003D798735
MKKLILALALTGLAGGALADTNVALNSAVSLSGSGFWNSPGSGEGIPATPASLVDGVFQPDSTTWNQHSVFWTGRDAAITITLQQAASVKQITLQADNNDRYLVEYLDNTQSWQELSVLGQPAVWGLSTSTYNLSAPVVASAFRISGTPTGDARFAVAEFQAIGTLAAVPEPSTYGMLGAGLALLGFAARRQGRKQA